MNRIIQVLIKNPLLFILPAAAIMLVAASTLFLMPDISKMMDIFAEMTNVESMVDNMDIDKVIVMMTASLKILAFSLIYSALSLVFISGYGNLQAAAVNGGKASFRVFLYGIKKFTGKVFLSFLLFIGVTYIISMILSLVTTPFIVNNIIRTGPLDADIFGMQTVLQIVMVIIMTLLYPLIILWLPAIFLDRQDKVTACFKNGLNAGKKKYLQVLPVVLVIMLPTLLLYLFSDNVFTMFKTPFFYLTYPYQMIAVPFLLTYIFFQYDSFKKEKTGALKVQ